MFGLFDHTFYSFLDLTGVLYHPLTSSYAFTGQGVGSVTVTMDSEKTFHEIGVDGVVIMGKIPSSSGKLIIECQQTSNVHKWLLYTYQTINTGIPSVKVKEWGRMTSLLRNLKDGTTHILKGVSFEKIPDKLYTAEGQMVTWVLWAASVDSSAPNPSGAGQLSALQKRWLGRFQE